MGRGVKVTAWLSRPHRGMKLELKSQSLHLVEGNLIVAPVVEAGRSGALVLRHLLRDFELATILDTR